LTFVDEKGVVKVTPSKKKGDALGIQKPDGTSLYGTRDLATIAARMKWFNPARIIYVVGGDQKEYFSNVFDSMYRYLGTRDVPRPDLVHVWFGAVELPEGPMSTRRGTVVPLRDVIGIMEDKVRPKVKSNFETRGVQLKPGELEKATGEVAIGSLIYYDLGGSSSRKIVYDADKITSFEGNTGAGLQYTAARINSVLETAGYDRAAHNDQNNWDFSHETVTENELVLRLGSFPDIVKAAADKYEPSIISEFLVQVASDYNSLLETTRVIDNPDPYVRARLLDVSAATRQILKNGLRMLNISVPDRM
jgi:arginyl-tRNA synthetase